MMRNTGNSSPPPDDATADLQRRLKDLTFPPADARTGVKSITLFGVRIDNVTLRGFLRSVCLQISQRIPGYIVTPNVDHLCRCAKDPEFRNAYDHALMALPDGAPVLWAGRLLGHPLREKLSGSDLVYRLSAFAAEHSFSVYFLGAAEGVAATAAEKLQQAYPGLRVAGVYSPPLGFENDPEENVRITRRVSESNADICFVALGSPKQELWMERYCSQCGVPVMIGIGAGLDFVAGKSKRAPRWMQRAGMEWLWRLVHEPRRLWRRYLVEDMFFFVLLGRHLAQRLRRAARPLPGN